MWPDKTVNPYGIPPRDPASEPPRDEEEERVEPRTWTFDALKAAYEEACTLLDANDRQLARSEAKNERLREALEEAFAELGWQSIRSALTGEPAPSEPREEGRDG